MSEPPISDRDESSSINIERSCVKITGAENDVIQLNEKQLPRIVPALNHAQIASSNISENLHNTIVQTCEICSLKTEIVSVHVAPIQASCEANHQCSKHENSRSQYQKMHTARASLLPKYQSQNANVNVLENDRNLLSSSNNLLHGNKNLRKRSFSQMNKSHNFVSLDLEDHHSPVRKKRALHLKEFSENGISVYQFNQQEKLMLKISPNSQNDGILPTTESRGSLVPVNEPRNLSLTPSSQTQDNGILLTNESCGSLLPVNQSDNFCPTPSSRTQNNGILPTNESYGSFVTVNQSDNLSLTASSQAQNYRILPTSMSYGSFVSTNQSQKLNLTLLDNNWNFTQNNRNLPGNNCDQHESLVPENSPCSRFLQNSQNEISTNKILSQKNFPQSSNLPDQRDHNLNMTLNSGISYVNSLFKDNRIGIDKETSSPKMVNFKNTNRMAFKEKMECHHFSSFSIFRNLRLEVEYRQKIVSSTYISYHSQGAKENNVGTSYPQVPVNMKFGSDIQNWSAVNSDVITSCINFMADNSLQATTLSTENTNVNMVESDMDWADDANTRHVGMLPAVNANMTKSCMEWMEEDTSQGSVLPAKNLDEAELHMDWTDDNPYHADGSPEMNADMSISCMDGIEDNSHQTDLLFTVNADSTAFGMDRMGNNSRRAAEFPSIKLSEIATPMDWIEDKIECKKKSRKSTK